VVLKGERFEVVGTDAAAIVLYFDGIETIVLEPDVLNLRISDAHRPGMPILTNCRCTSVEAVLHELLDHGARSTITWPDWI